MCGRIVTYTPYGTIAEQYFNCQLAIGSKVANYNLSPGVQTLAVIEAEGEGYGKSGFSFEHSLWAFKPKGAPEGAKPLINARAETVASKPSFREAFRYSRCVIPVDGYYEWMPTEQGKQPHYITLKDKEPDEVMFLAGLWEYTGQGIMTCFTIVTEPASPRIRHIHDRQPVMLDTGSVYKWLDRDITDREEIRASVKRLDHERLDYWPVSTRVNSVMNNDPKLIERCHSI